MKAKTLDKYKCMVCGTIKSINTYESQVYFYCYKCLKRTNHRIVKGQKLKDFKTLKSEFEELLDEFKQVIRQTNYALRTIENLSEIKESVNQLQIRIDQQNQDLIHSLNEQVIKEVGKDENRSN